MAIYASNSFEAGVASGTAISTANSGGASGRAFDQFAGTVVYDSAQVAHGALSGKFTQSSVTAAQARWVDASNTAGTCYARWYMYISAAPAASTRVMHFALAIGTQELAVRLKTDRHMDLLDSASAIMATSTTVIPTGQWVRFEAKMVPSATAGQGELKIFTTPDSTTPAETLTSTAAWNTGSAGTGMWRWGPTTGAAQTYTCWFDDVAVSFDAYIGPVADARSGSGTATAATSTSGTGSKGSSGSGSASLPSGTADGGTKAGTGSGSATAATSTTSSGIKRTAGAVTLTATSGATGTGTHAGTGTAGLVAAAGTSSAGAKATAGMGSTAGSTLLAAAGTHAGSDVGASGATAMLTSAGGKTLSGPVSLMAASGLSSSGAKRAGGPVLLTGSTGLESAGSARRFGVGQLAATVTLMGSGISGHQDLSHLSGTARVRIYSGKARVRELGGTARVRQLSGDAEV